MTHALLTSNLTRRFGERVAVHNLNLNVEPGDIYGFLGPNGAGKTTAIRCILRLIRPDTGQISIFGDTDSVRQRQHVGAVVETPCFHPRMSAWDNLTRAAAFAGRGTKTDIAEAIEQVGLSKREFEPVHRYSLGMKQRLGIARALLSKPKLLILDEPTNGLDPRGMKEVRDLLCRLASDNKITVFVSSHLLAEVEQMCTRVGIIEKGILIAEGTPEELTQRRETIVEIGATNPSALRAALSSIEGTAVIGEHGHGRVRASLSGISLPELNTALVRKGLEIDAFIPVNQSLESLFLSLTSEEIT